MELKAFVVQDLQGNVLSGASCYLYQSGTQNLVSGLVDATGAALTNPFTSNDSGEVAFRAPNGEYDLHVVTDNREITRPVQCLDVATVMQLEQQMASLLYLSPNIEQFLIDGATSKTLELGTSVSSVTLSWVLSGSEPESQTISNGVGAVTIGTTQRTLIGPFTANRNWVLTVTDTNPAGDTVQDQQSVSLNFRLRRYWGVSTNPSLNNAEVLALSSELATSKDKSITYDASGGTYLYYCYPESWGAITGVTVGGLAFSDYSETIQAVTNASGHTENYRILRFNSLQTGANIQVVWS